MQEDFLHFVWQYQLFDKTELFTTDGEPLLIIKQGRINYNAGPDFSDARIVINDIEWAGNVEIHVNNSDWDKHAHQTDKAYNSIILHVVYELDKPIQQNLPTLVLKNRIKENALSVYQQLQENKLFVPCQNYISKVENITKTIWLERLTIERLEEKIKQVNHLITRNNNNWEQTLYELLARNFGFKVNADAFQLLARQTPVLTFAKHKNSLFQIEAILFGQAGFLADDFVDYYPSALKTEYEFLSKKYQLKPIDKHLFKFSKLRPKNFPTIRLAQFAKLIYQSNHLFSKLLAANSLVEIKNLFSDLSPSDYWQTHYVFDKTSTASSKVFGQDSVASVIINTMLPILYAYGKATNQDVLTDKAMDFLLQTPADDNTIVANFNKLGIQSKNAAESQAVLQLYNNYCQHKKCLQCAFLKDILRKP